MAVHRFARSLYVRGRLRQLRVRRDVVLDPELGFLLLDERLDLLPRRLGLLGVELEGWDATGRRVPRGSDRGRLPAERVRSSASLTNTTCGLAYARAST